MKNFKFWALLPFALYVGISCNKNNSVDLPAREEPFSFTLENVAKMISRLPIEKEQLMEVYGAVNASSTDGYDEEYTMTQLFENPGAGVGGTKALVKGGSVCLKDMIADYLTQNPPAGTKAGAADVQAWLDQLEQSDMQIYWPYSEDWDGETLPLVTFDPGYEAESNYAYEIRRRGDGLEVIDSVYVDEAVAMQRPVWVINNNSDAEFSPIEFDDSPSTSSVKGGLYLKSLQALRNYDSWFAGASEFMIKCGSVEGIKSLDSDDITKFYPTLNDMMVVVKRSEVGKIKTLNTLLVSKMDDYTDKLAFLLTEDDGGTRTTWKCAASVKYKSKVYGFDIEIPFNSKDDIVWRGQISADYFTKTATTAGRFGDVKLVFEVK